jgi:hypothetical protein
MRAAGTTEADAAVTVLVMVMACRDAARADDVVQKM